MSPLKINAPRFQAPDRCASWTGTIAMAVEVRVEPRFLSMQIGCITQTKPFPSLTKTIFAPLSHCIRVIGLQLKERASLSTANNQNLISSVPSLLIYSFFFFFRHAPIPFFFPIQPSFRSEPLPPSLELSDGRPSPVPSLNRQPRHHNLISPSRETRAHENTHIAALIKVPRLRPSRETRPIQV